MNSEKLAGILGAIVAAVALVAAFVYGPIGQIGKPAPQAQKAEPAAPVAAAPPVRGPVVRDVPQLGLTARRSRVPRRPLRIAAIVPIWFPTATLMLDSSGAGTTTQ